MMDRTRHGNIRNLVCNMLDNQQSAQPNTVLYFCICQFKDGRASVERDVTRMTREKTIHDLRSGELQDVTTIMEVEFTDAGLSARDVTASLLMEADLMRGLAPPIDDGCYTDDPRLGTRMSPSDRIAALHDLAQDERNNWSK